MSQQLPGPNTALAQARRLAEGVSTQAVDTENIERVIGRIQHELQSLLLERAAIVKRIGMIKHTIVGLAAVFGAEIADEELQDLLCKGSARRRTRSHPGLTDLCRRTLMEASTPVTTNQLCDRIQETHPSVLERQKQPTTSVTVVLRRLVSYGEVQGGVNERAMRTWLWIGPQKRDKVGEDSSSSPLKSKPASNETVPTDTKA
jgi:hypothetical protein